MLKTKATVDRMRKVELHFALLVTPLNFVYGDRVKEIDSSSNIIIGSPPFGGCFSLISLYSETEQKLCIDDTYTFPHLHGLNNMSDWFRQIELT